MIIRASREETGWMLWCPCGMDWLFRDKPESIAFAKSAARVHLCNGTCEYHGLTDWQEARGIVDKAFYDKAFAETWRTA